MKRPTLLILSLTPCLLAAQSFFNLNGLGEPVYPRAARTAALGNPVALSPANPGNFLALARTSLALSFVGIGTVASENGAMRGVGTVRPAALSGALPLPTRTKILLGIDEIFNQDFDLWSDSISDTTPRHHIQSRGGIYALNAGIAQSFLSHFCLGVSFRQHLGEARENWHYLLPGGVISTDTIAIAYSASTARLGGALQFRPLTINACYDPPLSITARRLKLLHGVVSESLRTYHIRLPGATYFSAALGPVWKSSLIIGWEIRPWAQARIDRDSARYRNSFRTALGVESEILPDHPLRLGFSTGEWYCTNLTGKPITENILHFGTGIPIPKFGDIDLAGEIVMRASPTPSGVLKETSGRLLVTLAYQETWAKRTRPWGY